MAADGSVIIDTRMDTSGVQNGVSAIKQSFNGLGSAVKKIGLLIGGAFAVGKLVQFGKECVELGSDLAEVQNVVDVTFTTMSNKVNEFAKNAMTSAGLSETMAKRYVGTFGAMSKSFGFSEAQAYDMSTALTQLTGDVASFYNISQDLAYTKLKSVFTGETETLKDLGVVLTQSALDQYALANGYGKTTSEMTEQEKVALRLAFVQKQLSAASGDFIRTSDSWANQVRVMQLQLQSLKATIGAGLINIFTPVIKVINIVLSKLATVANAFKAFTELITGKKTSGGKTNSAATGTSDTGAAYSNAASSADDYADATKNVARATKKAKKEQNDYLSGLDEIRKYNTQSVEDSSIPTTGNTGGIDTGLISGGSVGLAVDYGSLAEGETVVDELATKFETLFNKIRDAVQPLAAEISRFGSIASDAFGWLFQNVLVPLSKWTINEVVPRFFQTLANIMRILNNVLIVLQPVWQWFWDNMLLPIAKWTGGVFLQIWDKINQYLGAFGNWIIEHQGIVQTFGYILGSFAIAWGLVTAAMKAWNTVTLITTVLTNGLKTAFSMLTSPIGLVVLAIGLLIAVGVALYKNWGTIKAVAKDVWTAVVGFFKVMAAGIAACFKDILQTATGIWSKIKNVFVLFGNWLKSAFSNDWTKQFGAFGNVLNAFFRNVKNIVNSIKKVFDGLIDLVVGVFTGDWKRAWEGVKQIFSGVWQGLASIVKSPLNAIIGGFNAILGIINSLINKINGISFKITVPDWVPKIGGSWWGFNGFNIPNIGTIPYLAKGAVIPPRSEFLAVLGDQKQGNNIETPEALLRKIVREESGGQQSNGNYRFTAQINRRTVFDEIIEEAKLRRMATGRNPLELI